MSAKGHICVFAKPPVAGAVKTRLIPAVGTEGTARLARAFLQDTWSFLRNIPWAHPVIATTVAPEEILALAPDAEVWLQGGGDLGRRIERILRRALRQGPFAIAIGADTPGIPPRLLDQARRALTTADAAIGPSEDGGFYLLGLKRCPIGLFKKLPWSEKDTFARTLARLKERRLKVTVLDQWFDVDRPEDLHRLRELIRNGNVIAQETSRVLTKTDNSRPDPVGISVIIPTLNEELRIPDRLKELAEIRGFHEVIVVDGGSRDRTVSIARLFPGVRVLEAPRGRASQMNAGARSSSGDILLFLHADTSLPSDAARWIKSALSEAGVVAGAFRTWTVCDNGRAWLAPLLHLADLRSRYSGLPYGDQAVFVRADAFWGVGGFPDIPLMEDLELSRRLRCKGAIRTVPATVRVSGRRFLARPVYYTVLVNIFPLLYRLGVPPRVLAGVYGGPR